jgi:type VI secretion system secreted protein Hcp
LITSANAVLNFKVDMEGISSGSTVATGFEHSLTHAPTSTVAHAELLVTKPVDRSSPLLALRVCDGQTIPQVRVEVQRTHPGGVQYYSLRLRDVIVTSLHADKASPIDAPTEQVSLNYTEIEWTYIETDGGGKSGSAISTDWSLITGSGGITDPDSDGDGIADSYEVTHGLKLLIDDASGDADQDGMTNNEEYRAGTSASDSNSVFRVTGVTTPQLEGVNIQVTFHSVPGRTYDLHATDVLGQAPDLVETVTPSGSETTVDLSLPGNRAFVLVTVRDN